MRWKRVLGTGFLLVTGVGAFLCVVLSTYDFSSLKPQVLQAAEEVIGRELQVDGDFTVKLGMIPTLRAERVHLQNVPWGARSEMVTVKRLEVHLALWSLIRKRLVIKKLVLIEPHIVLERGPSNRWNVDWAFDREADKKPYPSGRTAGGQLGLKYVESLLVEDARLTYIDHPNDRSHALFVSRLTALTEDADKPAAVAVTGKYSGRLFRVTGYLGPWTALTDPRASRHMDLNADAEGASVHVKGELRGGFDNPDLAVDIEASGSAFLKLFEQFGLTGTGVWKPLRARGRIVREDGRWRIPRLNVSAGRPDLAEIRIIGSVEHPLARRGIAIDVAARGSGLEHLPGRWFHDLPGRGPFHVTGRLTDPEARIYRITNLKATMSESDVRGWCEVDLTGGRPRLEGEFFSRTIDLRPFFPQHEREAYSRSMPRYTEGENRVFSRRPLPRPPRMIDGDVKIEVDNLVLPRGRVEDLQARLHLSEERSAVRPLKAKMCGGRLSGEIEVRTVREGLWVDTRLRAEDLEAACVLDRLAAERCLNGRMGVLADLQGKGESMAALMATLDGKASLLMGKGSVRNRAIEMLGADFGSILLKLVATGDGNSESTDINCLVALFNARSGRAKMTRLVMDTPQMRLIGSGEVELEDETLDIRFKPTPKKGILGLSLSPGNLTQSLKLGGTLRQPSITVSPMGTAINVGKALGGFLLLGPAGLATLLTSGCSGDENPCLVAIEETRVEPEGDGRELEKDTGGIGKTVEAISRSMEDAINGAGDTFKSLVEGEGPAAPRRDPSMESGF